MVDANRIERVFIRYAAVMSNNDFEAATALFAPDAVVRDPVDATALKGREQIRDFFSSGADILQSLVLTGPVRIAGDGVQATAPLQARVDFGDGLKTLDSIDVMTFDDAGQITSMHAYYWPGNLHDV